MPQAFANVPRVGWGKVQSHPSWDSLSYSLITTFQYYFISGASLVAQLIKNPPAIWKTWVRSLGSEDPLEKGKATHSSILAWRIPWTIQSMGLQRVGHDWVTFTFTLSLRSVQSLSHVRLFVTPWTAAHQASLSITNSRRLPKLMLFCDAIQPSHPLLSPSPTFNLSQHQGLFKWVIFSNQVAKVLEFQLQHQAFQWIPRADDGRVGSSFSPRNSQESSPTPQFKSINSSALSFLYSPTLTSIHDYWKNHSLDYTDLCWQSNVSAF